MYGAKCLFLHAEEEVIAQDAVTGPLEVSLLCVFAEYVY